jgi:hypothetical protein
MTSDYLTRGYLGSNAFPEHFLSTALLIREMSGESLSVIVSTCYINGRRFRLPHQCRCPYWS